MLGVAKKLKCVGIEVFFSDQSAVFVGQSAFGLIRTGRDASLIVLFLSGCKKVYSSG